MSIAVKINKLLALAGDPKASEGEIQAAFDRAQALMIKHHITEKDLETVKQRGEAIDAIQRAEQAAKGIFRGWVGGKTYCWEAMLATFVSEFIGCPSYRDNPTERRIGLKIAMCKSFAFYGIAEDAALAADLFNELHQMIITLATGLYGSAFKGDGGSYCEGFVAGLFTKLKKAITHQQQTEGALIVASQQLINQKKVIAQNWLAKEKGIRLQKGHGYAGARGSSSARERGIADGSNADISNSRRAKLV